MVKQIIEKTRAHARYTAYIGEKMIYAQRRKHLRLKANEIETLKEEAEYYESSICPNWLITDGEKIIGIYAKIKQEKDVVEIWQDTDA